LVAISFTTVLFGSSQKACSVMTKNFDVRITTEKFTEFVDSLFINKNIPEPELKINPIYTNSVDLRLMKDLDADIISSVKKNSSNIKNYEITKVENTQVQNRFSDKQPPKIYNISLNSGGLKQNLEPIKTNNINRVNDAGSLNTINEAKRLISINEYAEAEELIDDAVLTESKNAWALAEYASLYERINKYNKAAFAYKKALNICPGRIEILYSYSICLYKNKNFDEALSNLRKIISINPEFMLAHFNSGNIYYQKAEYQKALESFVKSIEINPLNVDAIYNTALTLELLNHKKLAEKYYKKCLEIKPDDLQALNAVKRLQKA